MANYQNILRQAHQAIADVADNADSWRAFLRSAAYTTHARQVNRLSRHLKKIFVLGGVPFIKAGGGDHAALEGNTAAKHRFFSHRFGAGIDDLLSAAKTGQPPLLELAHDLLPA